MSRPVDLPDAAQHAVNAVEAIRRVNAGEAWLLDVREASEWQAGHAVAAHHIPMADLQARLGEVPIREPILVVCHVGGRSRLVTEALVRAGYPAANVIGGMDAWRAAGGDFTL